MRGSLFNRKAEKPYVLLCTQIKSDLSHIIQEFTEKHGVPSAVDYGSSVWEFQHFKLKLLSSPDMMSGLDFFTVYFSGDWKSRPDAAAIQSHLNYGRLNNRYLNLKDFMSKAYKGAGKRNKFNARKAERPGGLKFDSGAEAQLFDLLQLMEKSGEITDIETQPSVKLTAALIGYKPDFKIFDVKRGCHIWLEMKSKATETEAWNLRRRLWGHYGPGPLQVWYCGKDGPYFVREINPHEGE
ncbi:MAG: DUF1064 domain-containing protein [Pseudobdellovibrionaceae bacterium]